MVPWERPLRDAHWQHRRLRDAYAGRAMPVLPWWMSGPDEPLNPTERVILGHIASTSRLLDVGAGDRRIQKKLVAAGYRGRYETVDLSPEYSPDYLDLAEVPEAAYDAVMALEVVEHLPLSEFDGFVDGLLRALAPGGRLVISTPNVAFYAPVYFQDLGHVHAYEAPGLAAYLELRGVPCQVFRVDWRAQSGSPKERLRRHAVRFITRGLLQVDYAVGVLLLGQRVLAAVPPDASAGEPAPRRFTGDAASLFIAQVLALFVTFALTPIELRRMGAEAYASVALMSSAVGYLTFLDIGTGWALVRCIPLYRERGDHDRIGALIATVLLISGSLGVLAGATLALLAPWLTERVFHFSPTLVASATFTFRVAGALVPVVLLLSVASGVGRALGLFRELALFVFLQTAILNIVWVTVAGHARDVEIVALTQVALALALLLVWVVLISRHPQRPILHRQWDHAAAKELTSFGGQSTVTQVGWMLMTSADKLVLAAVIPAAALASYVVPFSLAARIMLVCSTVSAVAFPRFATLAAATVPDRRRLEDASRVVAVVTGILSLGLVWAGPAVLSLWISPAFARGAGAPLQWLALGFGVFALGSLDHVHLDVHGRIRLTMTNTLVCGAAGLAAVALLGERGGVGPASAGLAVALAACGVTNLVMSARFLHLPWWARLRAALAPLAPLVLAVGIAAAGLSILDAPDLVRIAVLGAVLVGTGAPKILVLMRESSPRNEATATG